MKTILNGNTVRSIVLIVLPLWAGLIILPFICNGILLVAGLILFSALFFLTLFIT